MKSSAAAPAPGPMHAPQGNEGHTPLRIFGDTHSRSRPQISALAVEVEQARCTSRMGSIDDSCGKGRLRATQSLGRGAVIIADAVCTSERVGVGANAPVAQS